MTVTNKIKKKDKSLLPERIHTVTRLTIHYTRTCDRAQHAREDIDKAAVSHLQKLIHFLSDDGTSQQA